MSGGKRFENENVALVCVCAECGCAVALGLGRPAHGGLASKNAVLMRETVGKVAEGRGRRAVVGGGEETKGFALWVCGRALKRL